MLDLVRSKTGLNKGIGICLDTGHASLTGNLFECLELLSADIITMHLQDNIGDNNGDKSIAEDDIHQPPGYGSIPWEKFFKKLNEVEYDGSLIFELKSDSIEGKNSEFILDEVLKFIKSEEFFNSDKILQL